jgi:hypothetical protein
VLACGGKVGSALSKSCDRFFSTDGGFWPTSPVSGTALPAHPSLAPLSDGTVLVAAGSLYVYDPSTDTFSQPGDLPNYGGKVAALGGDGSVFVADTTVSGDLLAVTSGGTVTDLGALPFNPVEMGSLGNGEVVLIAANGGAAVVSPPADGLMSIDSVPGGQGTGQLSAAWSGGLVLIESTTVFFLGTDHTWSTVGDLAVPRSNGVGAPLPDGRVLYAGGRTTSAPVHTVVDVDLIGSFNGTPCSLAGECLSRFCEGGFCCGTACGGACQTCATGSCAELPAGDPGHCGGTGSCAGTCMGDGGGCFEPAGCVDAGTPDAGPPDAGPPPDAGIPCQDDGGCPFVDSACGAACTAGICIYPTGTCGPCSTCDLGTCGPVAAGADPYSSCTGSGVCGGACDGDGGCAFPTISCSNGDVCVAGEHCEGGDCGGGAAVPNCCHSDADCPVPNDGGADTSCSPACQNNQCVYPAGGCGDCHRCNVGACIEDDTLTCSDNNFCTPNDHCAAGVCVTDPTTAGCCNYDSECPSATDVCKRPVCSSHACGIEPIPGCCLTDADCDDHNPDTLDLCLSHSCQYYFNVPDAGPIDAGPEDAGVPDAGHVGHDGGHISHDGGHDAGPGDAGPSDAGAESLDAGDGGVDGGPKPTTHHTTGCACSTPVDGATLAMYAPILLGLLGRRRRQP